MRETTGLGFVITANTGVDHPVQLARRFSTLDAISNGRFGWNVVTGSSQNAVAELFGHTEMVPHDVRYAIAAEYVDTPPERSLLTPIEEVEGELARTVRAA